ncbi:MAG: glycosyltransferase [Pegethrix bostrychoides GSE-TBD4-15B]|jgi:glycosyltransferase involved in cell wall biosynthesis|uniref:Glycosyltransferase n=1 Tax=Pegethrix bostrychoides GSE-TBD4-15B TaxID=2839662 RepID=A0A951U6P1_9CYAN|nr:glycosyltransferase [Pegethrix bostrychoides GSE-TBD4-15B]
MLQVSQITNQIGVVAIGRNEGERLVRCLKSLLAQLPAGMPIVYVDSGSTDGSVEMAQALGVHTIGLDLSIPFTMARGRNTGFQHLVEQFPQIEYVQFIDGDCELLPNWIDRALAVISADPKLAVVCGRRRERFPEASPYNRLADMEWNTAIGETDACGGDALMRVSAIQAVGGYNPSLIAGEEPEMCVRLRQQGWKIRRIEADMTLHDAAMLKFGQWWKRTVRGGWAMAAGAALHGATPERYRVKETRSRWIWGLFVPILALGLAPFTRGLSLLLLLGYVWQLWKVYQYRQQFQDAAAAAWLYAFFCVLGKFPEMLGQAQYWLTRWRGQQATLIEYKAPAGTLNKSAL